MVQTNTKTLHSRFLLTTFAVCLTALVVLAPQTAFAQTAEEEAATLNILLTSSSTTTTAGIVLTIVLILNADSGEDYLRENAVALRGDITLGAGESIEDLAAIYRVDPDDRAAFGKLVRAHREKLLPLLDEESLDRQRANRFFQTILDHSVAAGIVEPAELSAG